jgi:hypothetical protein
MDCYRRFGWTYRLYLMLRRWTKQILVKRGYLSTKPHCVTSYKTVIFIFTDVTTWYPTRRHWRILQSTDFTITRWTESYRYLPYSQGLQDLQETVSGNAEHLFYLCLEQTCTKLISSWKKTNDTFTTLKTKKKIVWSIQQEAHLQADMKEKSKDKLQINSIFS